MKTTRTVRNAKGLTLVEILVSTTIFLFVSTAIMAALLMFLRSHKSYSQTAYFNSAVRFNYERLMQELRNADLSSSSLSAPDAKEIVIYTHSIDAADTTKTVRYYMDGVSGNMRLMRQESGSLPSVVFSDLADYSFKYYTSSVAADADETSTPAKAADVRAVKLVLTPKDRHRLLMGKDADSISSGAANRNIIIRLRN